ncbi:MAG: hypothetical protein VKN33_04895 [Candidatus Sericytochromatia bacterium]|nr:hypothetical protein [Candidatus Sericytochromatia bacterium]
MCHQAFVRWSMPVYALLLSACTINATATLPGQNTPGSSPSKQQPSNPAPKSPTPPPQPTAVTTASPSSEPGTAAADGLKEIEPNNDFNAATLLPIGQVLTGIAGKDDEGDYFTVTTPEGRQAGWLKLTIEENDNEFSPWFKVYSKAKKQLLDRYGSETETPFSVQVRANPGTQYYVNLGDGNGQPYKLEASFTPVADPNEPNQDFDQATSLDLGKLTKFAPFSAADAAEEEDIDMFKCTLPADKSNLRIRITNNTTAQEPDYYWIKIYDSSKKEIKQKYGMEREDIDYVFEGTAGNQYYIAVTAGGNPSALSDLVVTAE